MCNECHRTICSSSCPYAEETIIGYCDNCGGEIYNGNPHYRDRDNHMYCSEECAMEFYEIKHIESWEEG